MRTYPPARGSVTKAGYRRFPCKAPWPVPPKGYRILTIAEATLLTF
jgi:hypothetical protein